MAAAPAALPPAVAVAAAQPQQAAQQPGGQAALFLAPAPTPDTRPDALPPTPVWPRVSGSAANPVVRLCRLWPAYRHHRYIFEEKEKKEKGKKEAAKKVVKARLQELGPRFTLRLQSLQKGTFDSKGGEFEWLLKPETEGSRRRFNL